MFKKPGFSCSVPTIFHWDAENCLIKITDPTETTTIVEYAYDYIGRRISEQATISSLTTTTRGIYDGWNMLTEYTGTTLSKRYLWGMDLSGSMQGAGGVGGLLSVNDGTATYYPTYDGNGNVSEYLNATGAVQAHYEYDPFGRTTVATGAKAQDFSHRFSTKPLDAETGLYYYGYRYYDPVTGRWPSRDPIEERGGLNLYGFVGNDGVNSWDYLGLECNEGQIKFIKFCITLKIGMMEEGSKQCLGVSPRKLTFSVVRPVGESGKNLSWGQVSDLNISKGSGLNGTVLSEIS